MTRVAYTGQQTLTFADYTDLTTGRTLTAEPGESYDIAPASGRIVNDIPEAWFAVIDGKPAAKSSTSKAQASENEEPDGDPADEVPQQS